MTRQIQPQWKLDDALDAFIGIDAESRIVAWNTQAAATFGWSAEEAIGRMLWDTIIPLAYRDAHQRGMERFRKTGQAPVVSQRLELSALHRDGREFPVEITISGPIRNTTSYFFGAFLRDISQRKNREEELRRAKESAEEQAKTLQLLNGISRELSAVLNMDELLLRIGGLLSKLLEYRTFSILLLDESETWLMHRFSLSGSTVIKKPSIPLDRGLVGYAARHREPVVVGDVRRDPRYIKFHDETRSELSVPLITKDKLIGVLDIENTSLDYFRESHVQAVVMMAAQMAVALENAILHDRVSAQERALDEDLRCAREVQTRLLPTVLPTMCKATVSALNRPARIIAGDLYDFAQYRRSGAHVGILGDVSGKGAPAALYAALTSGIIRSLIDRELTPAEMLTVVNQALMERPLGDRYVSLSYVLWDDVGRNFSIANAGLPKPVVYRNGKMEMIEVTGMPLGLFPNLEFEQKCVEAMPGDAFIFLTDGILDTCNQKGEEFDYSSLELALNTCNGSSAEEIKETLARALASHCQCVEPVDDQTLVVFKVVS